MLTLPALSDVIHKLIININDEETTMKPVKITIAIAACLLIGQSAFANTITVTLKNSPNVKCSHGNKAFKFHSGRTVTITPADTSIKSITHFIPAPYYKNKTVAANKQKTQSFSFNRAIEQYTITICKGDVKKKCPSKMIWTKTSKTCPSIKLLKDGHLANPGKSIHFSCT